MPCRLLVAIWLVGLPVAGRAQEPLSNVLPNGSFEQETAKQPAGWKTTTWTGRASFAYASTGHSGQHSVAISSTAGADGAWHRMVPVKPRSTYRLCGWIRTENVRPGKGKGALLSLQNIPGVATDALSGSRGWTRVEVLFESGDHNQVDVNCQLGGGGPASGQAWYDDLRLEYISFATWKPAITIEADKTGAPISPYLYGQFIEHLGRCIYGGIWAEMLDDRKFYYDVGAKESPWQPVGPAKLVAMSAEQPMVGAHAPRVSLAGDATPHGIVQRGLGLVAGKEYVGYVWLAGDARAAPVRVSLAWGDRPAERQSLQIATLGPQFVRSDLRFRAAAASDDGRLEITSAGSGSFRVGTLSLMPADNVDGMRADTLKLLGELNAPIYRWPGGNFVSGYDWRDGIGPRDRRPPRKNPAWKGIEPNDFGIDEFLHFCRLLHTEPYITVNSGQGDVRLAADEVQYVNGATSTPLGKLRARNGHPLPYRVPWFSVGNEMYGKWQLGHMPLDAYMKKHNEFARAMRAVDPSIKLVGVGAAGPWSEGMLRSCADFMDLISEHFYCGAKPGLITHVQQIPAAVRAKAEAHRRYRREIPALAGKDVRIALDEWNYWYGPHAYGELGTQYYLKDALGIAAGLHELARNSDLFFMANYAQTVNVIGALKTSKTAATLDTTGLALLLYRRHFGALPVAASACPPLDVAAAWTADRKALTVAVVNPTTEKFEIAVAWRGATLSGSGRRWQLTGRDPTSYNAPGRPPQVTITEAPLTGVSDKLAVGPLSVTLFELGVK
jgi:alpha-N-arabinofuranosidase